MKENEERYGYPSCPCRLASGRFEFDRDILCPCDYRDPDVEEFGACYCALYVSKDVYERMVPVQLVPERRPVEKQTRAYGTIGGLYAESTSGKREVSGEKSLGVELRMWYCRQCGYVVFREDAPYVCPICRARRDLFAELKT